MIIPELKKIITVLIFYNLIFIGVLKSEIIKEIRITGNDRISDETIMMFSQISINDNIEKRNLNDILKNLYETNFFENVSVNFSNGIIDIDIKENPIIQNISYSGIKANKIKKLITDNIRLKPRSSFNKILLEKDKENCTIHMLLTTTLEMKKTKKKRIFLFNATLMRGTRGLVLIFAAF